MDKYDSINNIRTFIESNNMVLIYIYSKQCDVCHVVLPQIKDIIKKYENIKIKTIDIDECNEIAGEFSIFTVPTVLLYINNKEYIREARFINLRDLANNIERYYKMIY